MGLLFSDFPTRGFDASQYQDKPDTTIKPDVQKAAALGCDFIVMRSSYGVTKDPLYDYFYQSSKGLMDQADYHYLDYYGHAWRNLKPAYWGEMQAEKIYELANGLPVFMDIESAGSYAPKIYEVWPTAVTIFDAAIARLDKLTNRATGFYFSTGMLNSFYAYHKWRPLFVANYNPVTPDYIRSIVKKAGWTDLLIWQYQSNGDIDGDGKGDGIRMGMETSALDLDIWMASEERYKQFFGQLPAPEDKPEVIEVPEEEDVAEVKVVAPGRSGLRIRTMPSTSVFSSWIWKLNEGEKVEILERVVSGDMTWVRIGYRQWVCERQGDVEYLINL